VAATAPGGRLVLTGILREQAQDVAEGFAAHGMTLTTAAEQDEWTLLTGNAP
jgi:ribosomal protein L11 methylase PrmA